MASTAEKLHAEDWQQIQGLVHDLRHALEQTTTADLASLLPPPGHRLRLPALRELIRADMDFHWRHQRPMMLEDYFKRLPELRDNRGLCLDLLHAEYEIRRHYGDSLSLKKLQARFPELFLELKTLIESGAAAEARPTLNSRPAENAAPADPQAEPAAEVHEPGGAPRTHMRDRQGCLSYGAEVPDPGGAPRTPRNLGRDAASDSWATLKDAPRANAPPANPPPAEIPDVVVSDSSGKVLPITGGYRLLARLGSGGYGQVWRAEAPGGVEVALKIIFRPLDHADAKREWEALELLRRLHHPFLVATHQFYALEDRLLIAMDLADGSLRDRLKGCRDKGLPGIPVEELLRYLGEAAEALDYLHEHQVLHRDIKPDNILLFQGHARVGDFGLARMLEITGSRQVTTTGTPSYMAPEVWNAQMSAHSDQYSLAATYVELRLGRPIFSSSSMMQLMFDHLERTPKLEGLPQAEQEVLLKALAKDPSQRYGNCREFHCALVRAVAPAPVPAPDKGAADAHAPTPNKPIVCPPDQRAKPGRRRLLLLAGSLIVAAVALAVWQFLIAVPRPKVYVPPHCRPEEPRSTRVIDGRTLYERIAYVLPDGTPIVFVLVPGEASKDLPAFYIMREKVTHGLFQKFAAAKPDAVQGDRWQHGVIVNGDLLPPRENDPVYWVTALDALRFADWLGGKLPAVLQWDKAAGRFESGAKEPGRGPFLVPWNEKDPDQIAVGRDRPLPSGTATHDESPCHCRDMAGNGLEWTRNLATLDRRLPPQFVDINVKDLNLPVRLRGTSYRNPEPYRFEDVYPVQERIGGAKDDISFRVVLELTAAAGPAAAGARP